MIKYFSNYVVKDWSCYCGCKITRHYFTHYGIFCFYKFGNKSYESYIGCYEPDKNTLQTHSDEMKRFEVPIRRFASKHNARIVIEK